MTLGDFEAIFFDLGETLVTRVPGAARQAWVPGAPEVLSRLRDQGVRLGLISNTEGLTRATLLALLPEDFRFDLFEAALIILSSESVPPVAKPQPGIFRLAVSAAGVEPQACLFCGESLPETLAAQGIGMRAARLKAPPASDLGELLQLLEQPGDSH
jgi:bacterial leucyl aminopeptidase